MKGHCSSEELAATLSFLRNLAEEGYWGSVTIKLEGGKIVHIVRQESIIPSTLKSKEEPARNDHRY